MRRSLDTSASALRSRLDKVAPHEIEKKASEKIPKNKKLERERLPSFSTAQLDSQIAWKLPPSHEEIYPDQIARSARGDLSKIRLSETPFQLHRRQQSTAFSNSIRSQTKIPMGDWPALRSIAISQPSIAIMSQPASYKKAHLPMAFIEIKSANQYGQTIFS